MARSRVFGSASLQADHTIVCQLNFRYHLRSSNVIHQDGGIRIRQRRCPLLRDIEPHLSQGGAGHMDLALSSRAYRAVQAALTLPLGDGG